MNISHVREFLEEKKLKAQGFDGEVRVATGLAIAKLTHKNT